MNISELEARLSVVESKLADLQRQVETANVRAGIQRGMAASTFGIHVTWKNTPAAA